jgi:hypothetical protein
MNGMEPDGGLSRVTSVAPRQAPTRRLAELAHGIGPGEVDPAVDDETDHYDRQDEKQHGDGLRAGDDHRFSIRAFVASGSEQPTIHAS